MTLTGGKATDAAGGAILNGGKLTVSGCVIDNNNAKYGGGIASTGQIFGEDLPHKGLLNVYDSTISNNTASSSGGGIYLVDCDLTISNDVCIMQNGAFLEGGGLAILLTDELYNDLTTYLIDVNIFSNTAGLRGRLKTRLFGD